MTLRRISRLLVSLGGAALLIGATAISALADERDFDLNNNSDYAIVHAYVSPTDELNTWGDDILGKDVLNPGETWGVTFDSADPNTCMWDLKVITDVGQELTLPQLNLCVITNVNVVNN